MAVIKHDEPKDKDKNTPAVDSDILRPGPAARLYLKSSAVKMIDAVIDDYHSGKGGFNNIASSLSLAVTGG